MPSTFLGFAGGGGGGGSSFFFGIAYGPTSFWGPPASGGASCFCPFAAGADWSCALSPGVQRTSQTNINVINEIVENGSGQGFKFLMQWMENMKFLGKPLC